MTAEITIMNRHAIALAADSAVTVRGNKIYNTANKLFMLSKYQPVGVMIYGSAEFMGIPWEALIKVYRKFLGKQNYGSLKEYATNFISFIEQDKKDLFDEKLQTENYEFLVYRVLTEIRDEIRETFQKRSLEAMARVDNKETIEKPDENKLFEEVINKHWKDWNDILTVPNLKLLNIETLISKYESLISKVIKAVFQEAPLGGDLIKKLKEIAANAFLKNFFYRESGVVIAGFGDDEIYPSYCVFETESMLENKLKHTDLECNSTHDNSAHIRFFAQNEMGQAFVRGIDRGLDVFAKATLKDLLKKLKAKVLENIPSESADGTTKISKTLDGLIADLVKEYNQQLNTYTQEMFIDKILDTVSTLPKEELAPMVETLVHLTSFKRKVSGADETVGGPIDVAVISKGDGFIWIKRKHYFDTKLNPHFLETYYVGEENER